MIILGANERRRSPRSFAPKIMQNLKLLLAGDAFEKSFETRKFQNIWCSVRDACWRRSKLSSDRIPCCGCLVIRPTAWGLHRFLATRERWARGRLERIRRRAEELALLAKELALLAKELALLAKELRFPTRSPKWPQKYRFRQELTVLKTSHAPSRTWAVRCAFFAPKILTGALVRDTRTLRVSSNFFWVIWKLKIRKNIF